MPLSAAQHADLIKQNWSNLWPLGSRERQNRLDQIIADHEQENDLRLVDAAMNAE